MKKRVLLVLCLLFIAAAAFAQADSSEIKPSRVYNQGLQIRGGYAYGLTIGGPKRTFSSYGGSLIYYLGRSMVEYKDADPADLIIPLAWNNYASVTMNNALTKYTEAVLKGEDAVPVIVDKISFSKGGTFFGLGFYGGKTSLTDEASTGDDYDAFRDLNDYLRLIDDEYIELAGILSVNFRGSSLHRFIMNGTKYSTPFADMTFYINAYGGALLPQNEVYPEKPFFWRLEAGATVLAANIIGIDAGVLLQRIHADAAYPAANYQSPTQVGFTVTGNISPTI